MLDVEVELLAAGRLLVEGNGGHARRAVSARKDVRVADDIIAGRSQREGRVTFQSFNVRFVAVARLEVNAVAAPDGGLARSGGIESKAEARGNPAVVGLYATRHDPTITAVDQTIPESCEVVDVAGGRVRDQDGAARDGIELDQIFQRRIVIGGDELPQRLAASLCIRLYPIEYPILLHIVSPIGYNLRLIPAMRN